MSREVLPLHAEDISALARSLRGQLSDRPTPPSHLEMLNMLARGSGFRNFQHLRAQTMARQDLEAIPTPPPEPPAVDFVKVRRLTRFFDEAGRLRRWPAKLSQRTTCLWVLWSRLPARRNLSELEMKAFLQERHLFGDHALLRRFMCDLGMVRRSPDCRQYQRIEQAPPAEALCLIRHLAGESNP